MYELKENGKVFTSESVGTGPSSYEKRIYRAAVSQRLRGTAMYHVSAVQISHNPVDVGYTRRIYREREASLYSCTNYNNTIKKTE